MKTEHCVEIWVPLINGEMSFGSGYSLGPHWVLTAHHVLFPPEGRDDSEPIEITWWDETELEIKETKPVTIDDVVWYNEQHDIALIHCDAPYEDLINAWLQVAKDYPEGGSAFKSVGYLSNLYNESGKQRRKAPTGKLSAFSERAHTVDLNGLDVSLSDDELWAGFSGSPIFCGGKLVAVARTVNTGENGAGLVASFIRPALGATGGPEGIRLRDLHEFLTPPADALWPNKLRQDVINLLQTEQAVYKTLKDTYREKVDSTAEINSEADLADGLYDASEDRVVRCFLATRKRMEEQNSSDGVLAIRHLAGVWVILLAEVQGEVYDLNDYIKDPSANPLALMAVEPARMVVEGVVARNEERRASFKLSGQQLKSIFDMTPENYTGLDENDSQLAQDVRAQIGRKTQPGMDAFEGKDVEVEIEEFALKDSGLKISKLLTQQVDRRGYIADQLELGCEEAGGSVYVRIPSLDQTSENSDLRNLHQWYPQLLVLEVSSQIDRQRTKTLAGLHRIILGAQKYLNEEQKRKDGQS